MSAPATIETSGALCTHVEHAKVGLLARDEPGNGRRDITHFSHQISVRTQPVGYETEAVSRSIVSVLGRLGHLLRGGYFENDASFLCSLALARALLPLRVLHDDSAASGR